MHECIAEILARDLWIKARGRGDKRADASPLARLRKTGFDTVLCSDAASADSIDDGVAHCRASALKLWLVVAPDRDGSPVFRADASPPLDPWLVEGDIALDPRRTPAAVRPGPIDGNDGIADAWRSKVRSAVASGVAGFVCRDADRLAPAFWSRLFGAFDAEGEKPRWIAWTAGLPPDRVASLVGAGFDTVCSSVAWWDGRSRWLVDEARRSGRVVTLAFAIDPFASATGSTDVSLPAAARLRIAAITGDALLVPRSMWSDGIEDETTADALSWFAGRDDATTGNEGLRIVSGPDAPVTIVVKTATFDLRAATYACVALVNPDATRVASVACESVTTALSGYGDFVEVMKRDGGDGGGDVYMEPGASIELAPGEVRVFEAVRLPVVKLPLPSRRRSTEAALTSSRLAIEAVTPTVDGGRFPVKRTAGEAMAVEADVFIDGHEKLGASLLFRAAGERDWRQVRMEPLGNDRFGASFPLQRVGRHEFTIEAWRDEFATYRDELEKKAAAGLDVSLELVEGAALVQQALAHARTLKRPELVRRLSALAKSLPPAPSGAAAVAPIGRDAMAGNVAALLASQTLVDLQDADHRAFAYRPEIVYPVDAERSAASFASWYELFPRSLGNEADAASGAAATRHGTFDDVIERLPAVRAMGFDVLYFPPIHPIGRKNRKGRNNSLSALDDDPGSPYAIGSADGGHDALHPQLGTFDDFRRLRDAALDNGLELALDFAIQCSPDHPWLQRHPGWFAWRPDGSLRYAENPPKKYEDIVNVDFYGGGTGRGDDSAPALWAALRDVILLWVEQGVRIFRVDNPHTKPLPFWEWMIGEVRSRYPDTIFLSEAFTRPKVMYRLAKVGFSQSYTYFTWRHTKQEFIDYLTELTTSTEPNPRDFFRPNFFVNTPDINPVFLQRSGRAGFLIRAALAATLSGLWGVYSGFELCEATPVPGKEDYLDSEKYQLRAWDWRRPGNIIAEITALNRIRNENPALRTHLNVRFHEVYDPNILYFVKANADRSNIVLVAINLDPYGVHEADFELPLWRWGLADDAAVDVTDLLDGRRFRWQGKYQRMRLDPSSNPYAIWRVGL